jgi:hypothetical protein
MRRTIHVYRTTGLLYASELPPDWSPREVEMRSHELTAANQPPQPTHHPINECIFPCMSCMSNALGGTPRAPSVETCSLRDLPPSFSTGGEIPMVSPWSHSAMAADGTRDPLQKHKYLRVTPSLVATLHLIRQANLKLHI